MLTGIIVLVVKSHAPITLRPAGPKPPAEAKPLALESEWTRFRIRSESLYLRTLRGNDRAALLRLTSQTLRGALAKVGVDKDRIEERVNNAAANADAQPAKHVAVNASTPPPMATLPAPIQWHIEVPRRASLYRINDAITQAMDLLGGNVIRGVERPAPLAGILLDLRVGYGNQVTHAITVEPSETMADPGAQIAFVVTDLDKSSLKLYRAFMKSPLVFSAALRPDKGEAVRVAKEVRQEHHDVLLHLPMEPKGYPRVDPGKDAILLDLSRIEIEDRIARCLSSIGPVQGVVSRLGSAALNDPDVMRAVLEEMKRRDLPFIDAHNQGASMTEEIGEETGARTLMAGGDLDDEKGTAASVRAKLRELTAAAVQKGSLIVMVHPSPLVLDILESEIPKMKAQGLEMVAISRVTQ